MLKNKCFSYTNQAVLPAFTLAEALVSLLMIGIVITVTIPIMTQMSEIKTGNDKQAMKCIINDASEIGYDTDTGDTTIPAEGTDCYAAITKVRLGTKNTLDTIKWKANHGTTEEQTAAKIILRTACDQGGENACDYFIHICKTSGSSDYPYCDDISSYFDITYYLKKPNTTTNQGSRYIIDKLEGSYPDRIGRVRDEVFSDCIVELSSIACTFDPQIYIKECNLGNILGCRVVYTKNYMQSCTEVKTAWNTAPSGYYKLTIVAPVFGLPSEKYCNMTNLASAAISGCNRVPSQYYIAKDCEAGRNNDYNRTCDQILTSWPDVGYYMHKLTGIAADPPDPGLTYCGEGDPPPQCVFSGAGTTCDDGTIYAGEFDLGEHNFIFMFAAPIDQGLVTWNNGTEVYTETTASDENNGQNNYTILTTEPVASDESSPYIAVGLCKALNDANGGAGTSYDGGITYHNDWYLTAASELYLLRTGQEIGDFFGTYDLSNDYWSSTESFFYDNAIKVQFTSSNVGTLYFKKYSKNVRCNRRTPGP